MNIFLYGPSGSGKSTVGRLLASRLEVPWSDLDSEIEKEINTTIEAFFGAKGEPAFRDIETRLLAQVIEKTPTAVISLGGGALLREENRHLAEKSGRVVVLSGSLETLLSRLMSDSYVRPLIKADPRQKLAAMLERRSPHYTSFGEPIQTDGASVDEIARQVQVRLGCYRISGMGNPYDVMIECGSLDRLGAALTERGLHGPSAVVADENVAPLYMDRVRQSLAAAGIEASPMVIPAGEEHKTIQTITHLWEGFLGAGVERSSTVIALGGGVTGDMTGFAAATFLRGVPWVNVPTTLLSMVDSSLGGKTGADLPQGKNLIGAFHAPSLVQADPRTLSTLPAAEIKSGLAETIKHAIIADVGLFYQMAENGWPVEIEETAALLRRSVAVKVDVINADPYEKGLRQALNFGHTAGHGIERASNYRLSHGESVAIGMVVEARLAEKIGLAETGLSGIITEAFTRLGLPVHVPESLDRSSILQAMLLDKKRSLKQIHFALPETIGKMRTGVVIDQWQELIEL